MEELRPWMEFAVIAVVLLIGVRLILFGIGLAHRISKRRGAGDMQAETNSANGTITLTGPVGAVLAALCILGGIFLLSEAMDMFNGGAPDNGGRFWPGSSVVMAAGQPSVEGWAYVGPGNTEPDQQASAFTTLLLTPELEVMRTTQPVTLLENHYERFTGSLVGYLLGYREPESSGQLDSGACVRVTDHAVVGNGHDWRRVELINPNMCDRLEDLVRGAGEIIPPPQDPSAPNP